MADEQKRSEEQEQNPEPEEELVEVFTTGDDSEALVVRGLLEAAGIEAVMRTPEAPIGVFPMTTGDLGEVALLVREEQADEARRVIEESRQPGTDGDSEE